MSRLIRHLAFGAAAGLAPCPNGVGALVDIGGIAALAGAAAGFCPNGVGAFADIGGIAALAGTGLAAGGAASSESSPQLLIVPWLFASLLSPHCSIRSSTAEGWIEMNINSEVDVGGWGRS